MIALTWPSARKELTTGYRSQLLLACQSLMCIHIYRRQWLNSKYDPNATLDSNQKTITFEDFIDKELIQFSYADNQRSLPSIIDGLKPCMEHYFNQFRFAYPLRVSLAQRKILYACFKRKLDQEIKVVQLAGKYLQI